MTQKNELKVLIVDDETAMRELIKTSLKLKGIKADTAASVSEAKQKLEKPNGHYFLIVSDYMMPGENGIDLLKFVKNVYSLIEVIIITGAGTEEIAIQALRKGAMDYIKKPINIDEIIVIVQKAKEIYLVKKQNIDYFNEIKNIKKNTDSEIESFKQYLYGVTEELAERRLQITKVCEFLEEIKILELSQEINKKLKKLFKYLDYNDEVV